MHLAVVPADQHDDRTQTSATDLAAAVLAALGPAGQQGLSRQALRLALRVRNQSLGETLTRPATTGHVARHGDAWVRLTVPVPAHIDTHRNGPPEST